MHGPFAGTKKVALVERWRKVAISGDSTVHYLIKLVPSLWQLNRKKYILHVKYMYCKLIFSMLETNQGLCCCLYKAYEVIMYCTKHSNHNVVTASLETLLQLLRTPPRALLAVLLSSEGITPTTGSDTLKKGTDALYSFLLMLWMYM